MYRSSWSSLGGGVFGENECWDVAIVFLKGRGGRLVVGRGENRRYEIWVSSSFFVFSLVSVHRRLTCICRNGQGISSVQKKKDLPGW